MGQGEKPQMKVNPPRIRSGARTAFTGIDGTIEGQLEAAVKHRDGFSCRTRATYTYDANGHKRWCTDCGAELGEQAYVEHGGADVPGWAIGAVLALLGCALLAVVYLVCLAYRETNVDGLPGTPVGVHTTPAPAWPSGAEPSVRPVLVPVVVP